MRACSCYHVGRLSVPVTLLAVCLLSTVVASAQNYYYYPQPPARGYSPSYYYRQSVPGRSSPYSNYGYSTQPFSYYGVPSSLPRANPVTSGYYTGSYAPRTPYSSLPRTTSPAAAPQGQTASYSAPGSPAASLGQINRYVLPGLGTVSVPADLQSPVMAPTPVPDPILTTDDIKRVQSQLIRLGYNLGWADGVMGDKTRVALQKFQKDNGLMDASPASAATIEMLNSISANLKTIQTLRNYVPRFETKPASKTTPPTANPDVASSR